MIKTNFFLQQILSGLLLKGNKAATETGIVLFIFYKTKLLEDGRQEEKLQKASNICVNDDKC